MTQPAARQAPPLSHPGSKWHKVGQAPQTLYIILLLLRIFFSFLFVSLSPLHEQHIDLHYTPPSPHRLCRRPSLPNSRQRHSLDSLLATTPSGAPSTRHRGLRGLPKAVDVGAPVPEGITPSTAAPGIATAAAAPSSSGPTTFKGLDSPLLPRGWRKGGEKQSNRIAETPDRVRDCLDEALLA